MGLYLRKNSSIWWMRYKRDGRTIDESTGTHDRRKAEIVLQRRRAERTQRKFAVAMGLPVEEALADARLTLDAFLGMYEDHYLAAGGPDLRESRAASWRGDKWALKKLIDFFKRQGVVRVADVERRHVERFRDWRLTNTVMRRKDVPEPIDAAPSRGGRGRRKPTIEKEPRPVSGATVNHDLRVGRAAWSWAVRMGLARTNPFVGVRPIKLARYDPRNLTEFEIRKLFDAARGETLFPLLATAIYSGLRLGELIALDWRDIDFEAGEIRVRCDEAFRTKSRKPRVVPLAPALRSILEPLRRTRGLVFASSRGAPLDPANLRRWARRLGRRAGIAHFTLHDLRRTFASLLAAKGVPTTRIRDYLGHASIATTESYYIARGQVDHGDLERLPALGAGPESAPAAAQSPGAAPASAG